jgi:hypothetical protein
LPILLLVEGDVVIPADLDDRVEELILLMLPSLLLLHNDGPLYIQVVVLVLQDLKEGGVLAAIDPDLLELVPEVLLDGQLFES